MQKPPLPANELERLLALAACSILDTPAEADFDALTELVAELIDVPMALVSLVDADRQWFKSRVGLDVPETARDVSFCAHVVASGQALVVQDTLTDARFADNPLVLGPPNIRFYAGFPVHDRNGLVLGTLCALDRKPRQLGSKQRVLLARLANQASSLLQLRRANRLIADEVVNLLTLRRFFDMSLDLLCTAGPDFHFLELNPAWQRTLGWSLESLRSRAFLDLVHPDDLHATVAVSARMLEPGSSAVGFENRYLHKDGGWIWLSWVAIRADGIFYATARDVSQAKQEAQTLAENEARLRNVLAAANFSIIATDMSGIIQVFSPGAERLLGYQAREMVGQQSPAIVHDPGEIEARARVLSGELSREVAADFDVFVAKARVDGLPDEQPWTYVRKDGSRVPVRLSVTAMQDASGQLIGYLGVAQDQSGQRAAEQYAAQLFESAPNGLVVTDREGTIQSVNAKVGELFGQMQALLLGQRLDALVAPKQPVERRQLLEMISSAGRSSGPAASLDFEASGAEQREFALQVSLSAVQTPKGPGVLAALTDVTTRVTQARYMATQLAVLGHLTQASSGTDAIGRTLRQLTESLKWDYAAFWQEDQADRGGDVQIRLRATSAWSRVSPAVADPQTTDARYESGTGLSGRCWAEAKALWRTEAQAADSGQHARADLGRGLRTFAAFPVISEARVVAVLEFASATPRDEDSAVNDLMHAITTALGQVLLRYAAEDALVAARQAAEKANQTKGLFLANMSHEIRTPMSAILGLAHLALQTELTVRQRDYVTKISAAARALLGLINDILDFSKIEADKLTIDHVPFHLDDVLSNLSSAVGVLAGEKGLEVIFDVPLEVPRRLIGDPLRLQQVLLNLCANAVKFTPKGEIVVTVRLEPQPDHRCCLKASVRDTGIGMTQGVINQLFQAFTQADSSTTRRHGGTGLGLSICKKLVELMQGTISVTSQPGIGTTFDFSVLVSLERRSRAKNRSATMPPGLRVLVVDDSESARTVAAQMLRSWNCLVDTAVDGPTALSAWLIAQRSGKPYELVVLDWRMPGLDGIEVARRLFASVTSVPVRVVLVSAHNDDGLVNQAELLGIHRVLTKPLSASVLHDAVVEALHAGEILPNQSKRLIQAGVSTQLRGAKVLLVEDNDINQQIAVEVLQQAGLHVQVANHGQEAVSLASAEFAVILMDLQMPVMDGYAAAQAIHAMPGLQDTPIIAMTANVMAEDRARVSAAGMCDFVGKPIDPEQLLRTLARWIEQRQKRVALAKPEAAAPALPEVSPGTPPEESPFLIELPEHLPGVDLPTALLRLGGNATLLADLLIRFRDRYARTDAQVQQALAAGDRKAASRLVHSVKGLAANLGIDGVAASAGAVERQLTEGQGAPAGLAAFSAQLALACAGLAQLERVEPMV